MCRLLRELLLVQVLPLGLVQEPELLLPGPVLLRELQLELPVQVLPRHISESAHIRQLFQVLLHTVFH